MITILGLIGFKGNGKDSLAKVLVNKYGWEQQNFAEPLRDVLSTVFGWERELLNNDTPERRQWRETIDTWWANKLGIPDFTPRKAFQLVGTQAFRNIIHEDIWVIKLENYVLNSNKNVVISDCRFGNEIDSVRAMGGKIAWIDKEIPVWYDKLSILHQKISLLGEDNQETKEYIDFLFKTYGAHESEWRWVFHCCKPWAKVLYDIHIDNRGTLDELELRVDEFINRI